MAIIGNIGRIPVFDNKEEAVVWGKHNGLTGHHTHIILVKIGYMGGDNHVEAIGKQVRATSLDLIAPEPISVGKEGRKWCWRPGNMRRYGGSGKCCERYANPGGGGQCMSYHECFEESWCKGAGKSVDISPQTTQPQTQPPPPQVSTPQTTPIINPDSSDDSGY